MKEYSFYYANLLIRSGLTLALIILWMVLLGGIEYLLFPLLRDWPPFVVPLVYLAGLPGAFFLRQRLTLLYFLPGTGRIEEDRVELQLRFRRYAIPFETVRRLGYRDTRRFRGLVIDGKPSLFLDGPPREGKGHLGEALCDFSLALEEAFSSWKTAHPNG